VAVLLYANGLTEEFRPREFTFTDEELIEIFGDFDKTRTFRLYEVPNTWCVWGQNEPIDKVPDEFNKIGTDILEQECYSPILFLHDTEIDPSWNLTDRMILSGYDNFKLEMIKFFDDIAADIMEERRLAREEEGMSEQSLIVLEQIGISEDKRIIFKFDIDKQKEEFFIEDNLLEFAKKVHNFLKFKYKDGDIFAVYADKNIIMIAEDLKVKPLIEKLIAFFKTHENYEACSVLRNTFERWEKYKQDKPKKSPVKKDSKEDDSKETK
jgi:hypothetical protein